MFKADADKRHCSGRVFTQWNGVPAHPHSFNFWLKRFIEDKHLPHISPHSFRHMSASYLIAAGTDIRTASGKLGHAKTSTTMNIYAHLLKSAEKKTADTMETFLQQTTEKARSTQKKQANQPANSLYIGVRLSLFGYILG
jgi:Site-specific recombinase XerD